MSEKRFTEIVSTQIIHDNTTGRDWHGLMEDGFVELINELNEENMKNIRFKERFRDLSYNAHNFLRIYDQVISELYNKYPTGSHERKVLDELEDLYARYEKELELR